MTHRISRNGKRSNPIGAGKESVSFSASKDFVVKLNELIEDGDVSRSEWLRTLAEEALAARRTIRRQVVQDRAPNMPTRASGPEDLRDRAEVSVVEFECSAGRPLNSEARPIGRCLVPARYAAPGAFVLRINGDSMDRADLPARLGGPGGIQPGDRVVMQWVEQREPRHRDIVAVQIFGDGSTLKRFHDNAGERWLEPESANGAHHRIALSGDGEPLAKVQAVMIGKLAPVSTPTHA